MRAGSHGLIGGMIALILAIMPALGTAGPLPARAWQIDGATYTSPQYGYVVAWDDQWAASERRVTSDEGGEDAMTLTNNDGAIRIAGRDDSVSAEALLEEIVAEYTASTAAITTMDTSDGVSTAEVTTERDHILIEAQAVDGVVVAVSLTAREADYATALAAAQDGVTLNGTPILTGAAAGPIEERPTEEATEQATEEPTEEADQVGIDGDTYTSPYHEFSLTWGDEWEASATIGDDDFNYLQLTSDTGGITIVAGSYYEGDAEACLAGEDAYFSTEDPTVEDWQPAVDRDGEPITGGNGGMAYGVFTLSYGGEDDGFLDLVDYIECRELVPGETVLEIFASTTPDLYEEHIAAVLAITNAIEMPAESPAFEPADPASPDLDAVVPGTEEATEEPTEGATEEATGEATEQATEEATEEPRPGTSGFDGNTFTSPSFGFTVEVPADWTVADESLAGNDETVVLDNGTSVITLHATDAYSGDLPGCVDYVRSLDEENPAYQDLTLELTTDGDPFQGADDRSAYMLLSYTGDDGEQWAHFIHCQSLVEGESVLILTQDAPFDDYASERGARRQIQNAIDLP